MSILNQRFFQMSNAVFCHGLKPIQLAVYSYLKCCAGQKETCYPRMKTIAACCSCSESAAREAIRELERRGFIYTRPSYRKRNGLVQQTSNTYYIRDLPDIPKPKEEVTIIQGEIRGSGAEEREAG